MSVDATWLSTWFVYSYIRKCSQLSPDRIFRLFDNATSTMKLRYAVSAVVAWKLNNSHLELWVIFCDFVHSIGYRRRLGIDLLTAQTCERWMSELTKTDSGLSVYFTAVVFLHVAYRSSKHGLNGELMDVVATLFGQVSRLRQYSYNTTSLLSQDKAAKLMKFVTNTSLSTMSLIAIELSKAYLYRALRCKDSDSDSIYCLANVYLSVLHNATGQYQTAIDHCTLVMKSQNHLQCGSHVVQGELLPKIDDDFDNMLGLAVFYQYVQAVALNQQCRAPHVTVLTTELFAYLHIKYSLLPVCHYTLQSSATDEFKRYEIHISGTVQLFVGDVLLFVSLSRLLQQKIYQKAVWQQLHKPKINTTEHSASDLVELLQKSAREHLTAFRQVEARDFGSVGTTVTTDFKALYAYKRGDYQQCLQLSTQNVYTLLYAVGSQAHILVLPFIQLMNDDILSLTALTLIVNPKCRVCGQPGHGDGTNYVSQMTLSLYLMTQCQLKLHHSVTSLAHTLDYIKVARKKHARDRTLDHLTLNLIERKVVSHVRTLVLSGSYM